MAFAAHEIGPAHDFVVELEAPVWPAAPCFQLGPLRTRKGERGPVVDRGQAARLLALAFAIELLGGFKARIKAPSLAQFSGSSVVERESLRLAQHRVRYNS